MRTHDEIRIRQARRLHGLSRAQGFRNQHFKDYLSEVPPLRPGTGDPTVFNRPVLIDGLVSLPRACIQLRIGRIRPFSRFTDRHAQGKPILRWIWCHDPARYLNFSPEECVSLLEPGQFALDALGGIAFHLQYQSAARRHFIDLPGSVWTDDASYVACLGPWTGYEKKCLHVVSETERSPRCGSMLYCHALDPDRS